jgi:hypothetical protein
MTNPAATPQPAPQPGRQVVLSEATRYVEFMDCSELVPDLIARAEEGKVKYGTYLMTMNGRDARMDCYQELLDGLMYIMQAMLELPEEEVHHLVRVRLYLTMSVRWLKAILEEKVAP